MNTVKIKRYNMIFKCKLSQLKFSNLKITVPKSTFLYVRMHAGLDYISLTF